MTCPTSIGELYKQADAEVLGPFGESVSVVNDGSGDGNTYPFSELFGRMWIEDAERVIGVTEVLSLFETVGEPEISISECLWLGDGFPYSFELPLVQVFGNQTVMLPLVTVSGELRQALTIRGDVTLPLVEVAGTLRQVLQIAGAIDLPLVEISGALRQVLTIVGDVTLPLVTVGAAASEPIRTTYFINTQTLAVSWATLPVVAAVGAGETLYLATPAVLGTLDADIEATATPYVQTGKMALKAGKTCTVHPAYITASGADLELEATRDDGTEKTAIYAVPAAISEKPHKRAVPMGKGATGDAWQLTLRTAPEAAAATIDLMSIEINSSKR